ncbi:WhiB family transcriptional regulator [Streptomyces sp. NBC_01635]|uniref:WhiB family transcriptional regulator n=1 Tax=Streptomyces sp. NBC_01635 TaxID=2975904 RepID=UPI00386E7165|nr:WhiB family transcriptional regulator [Streptomyces sp. NBC_01635]
MSPLPHFLDAVPGLWPEIPCRERPHLFVGSSRATPHEEDAAKAKALYAQCPVRGACAACAIRNDYRDGIWGGLTADERDQLARERATATDRPG